MQNTKSFSFSFLIYLSIIFVIVFPHKAYSVPAAPIIHTLIQSDGSTFKARQWGDEASHGWETEDGDTIVQDHESRNWTYAMHDADGNLVSSAKIVGKHQKPANVQKHIRLTGKARFSVPVMKTTKEISAVSSLGTSISAAGSSIASYSIASSSSGKIPVLLVNFSNTSTTYSANNFNSLLFGSGNFSMKDYYTEVSYSKFSLSGVIQGWYRASQIHDYYGEDYYLDGVLQHQRWPGDLVYESVSAADAAINFAAYDIDGDCYVDVVAIVHQGAGQEASGNSTDIWSHRWSLSDAQTSGKSHYGAYTTNDICPSDSTKHVIINDYIIQPEIYSGGISTVGVFAHEYGHSLGLPDLYDTDNSSEGVGNWSLMGCGSWNYITKQGDRPAHMDAWSKYALGWAMPSVVSSTLTNQTIRDAEQYPDTFKLIPQNSSGSEYFLIENRQRIGFDIGLPGSGLLIWHIDSNVTNNNSECYPGGPLCSSQHYNVALVQADNKWDLEKTDETKKIYNRGDAGDPYPGSSINRTFTVTSAPNSNYYSGSPSYVNVTNISNPSSTMTATLSPFYIGGAISNKWNTLSGAPGNAISNEYPVYNSSGAYIGQAQDFLNGTLYWHQYPNPADPNQGQVYWMYGSILQKYKDMGQDVYKNITPMLNTSSNEPLLIGNAYSITDLSGTRDTKGIIDEVHILNRAINAQEVASMYSSPPSVSANTVLLLHMDSIADTIVPDASGKGNNGTLGGNTLLTTGKFGNGLQLDGVDDYILINNAPTLNFGKGSFSVFMWVKLDNTKTPQLLLNKYAGDKVAGWNFRATMNGMLRFMAYDADSDKMTDVVGTSFITDNQWHFVGVVVDKDAVETTLYVDRIVDNPRQHWFNTSILGLPISDIYTAGSGSRSDFENGYIELNNGVATAILTINITTYRDSDPSFFWATYSDYLSRLVSARYTITNNSSVTINNIKIDSAYASAGVTLNSYTLPPSLGPFQSAEVILKWNVPAGVTNFRQYVHFTCDLSSGTTQPQPSSFAIDIAAAGSHVSTRYNALNGTTFNGITGSATNSEYAITGGYAQDFANGRLIFNTSKNQTYWLPKDSILTYYDQIGGATWALPISDEYDNYTYKRVDFSNGYSIVWSSASGAFVAQSAKTVGGAISTKYYALGGAGVVGTPLFSEYPVYNASGVWVGQAQDFTNGRLYWHKVEITTDPYRGQVFWVHGAIILKYDHLGRERGFLGLPISDEYAVSTGRASNFQGGYIYWSSTTSAHVVYGAILGKYLAIGGPGYFGFPVTDEYDVPCVAGARESDFTAGRIYWSASTGPKIIYGGILQTYIANGGSCSALGIPTSDEYSWGGGRRNDFQHGYIFWSASGGAVVR